MNINNSSIHPVYIISGPTASGKTSCSIALAKDLIAKGKKAVIVNFDSLLFYRGLNIGTAKPSLEEQDGIEHFLMDINSPENPINAAIYCRLATPLIQKLLDNQITPILVGGSGFYIRALVKGMIQSTTTPPEIVKTVQLLLEESGIEKIREELQVHDLESFNKLHPNDHYRNCRALEHFYATGSMISDKQKEIPNPYDFSENIHPNWNITHYYLHIEKEDHLKLIESRTQEMLNCGLIQEYKELLKKGLSGLERPMQSIGYKQVGDFLKGEIKESELAEKISIATRQLAKAQRTFFKKVTPTITLHPHELLKRIQEEDL
jgi:tRNA dimethylallyltransferase